MVYDKKLNIFRRSRPGNDFYEKSKNIVNIKGEKNLVIEKVYSHLESELAPVIALIENSAHTDKILNSDLIVRLKLFVEVMRWRNPALDDVYKNIIQRMEVKDLGFNVVADTREKSKEVEERIMGEPTAWQMLRPFMAVMGLGSMADERYDTSKWNILYQDGGFSILGDFPIIFNPLTINNFISDEFIFPLSAQRTIIYSDVKQIKQLPNRFTIDKDLAQIHLANRFVCCKQENYLRFMIKFYDEEKQNINDKFFEDMFINLAKGK